MLEDFEEFLKAATELPQIELKLAEAVHYALFPGGKRLRPNIVLSIVSDLVGKLDQAYPYACAIEILHCASLVHDDLPTLDNDSMRRGRPTCHVEFGEQTALIAADLMVGLAFKCLRHPGLAPEKIVSLTDQLATAWVHLCSGQALDLQPIGSLELLLNTHRQKTGALFAATLAGAGIIAGLTDEKTKYLHQAGESLGVLFQLVDDLIDQFGKDQERGRVGSSDNRNNRSRLEVIGDIESALRLIKNLQAEILEKFNLISGNLKLTLQLLDRSFSNVPSVGQIKFF